MNKNYPDLRVIKTRQCIHNALVDLLTEKNFADITVTEISARAMINRKTFYRHYQTVSDALTAVETDILESFINNNKNNNSCLKIDMMLSHISSLVEENKETLSKMISFTPELLQTGRFKELLCRATEVALKNIGGLSDQQMIKDISKFLVSGIISIYSDWLMSEYQEPLDQITQTIQKMIFGALRVFVSEEKL